MKLQFKQDEIVSAIRASISAQGFDLTNKDVAVKFTAGRKAGGLVADVDITDKVTPSLSERLPASPAAPTSSEELKADQAKADAKQEALPDPATQQPEAGDNKANGEAKPSLFS